MDKLELQRKLSKPYSTESWEEVVQFVFPNVQILNPAIEMHVNDAKVEKLKQIGNVRLMDGKHLALFELKLKANVNIIRNRVELNNIVSKHIDQDQIHGVLSIFEQGGDDYRFTFSARSSEFDASEGEFKNIKTDTKRFTYVLGKNESCKTPAERFFELSKNKTKADIHAIEDAFSVEKLSKLFFTEYKIQFKKFVDYLIQNASLKSTIFKGDDKNIRDFVKILFGRIVFIKFVQKKGWMGVPATSANWVGGDFRFLENSFANFSNKEIFYSEFLEPLFYEALNKPDRPKDVFAVSGIKVPYLSGGLFEKGAQDNKNINFPAELFEGLFEFLDRFNFTIDESDVNDHEVGIDPEMLGHIFENLLEDNKDKGAFYTPKEIVRYMCQESLREYLKASLVKNNQWPSNQEEVRKLENSIQNFVVKKEAGGIVDFDKTFAIALKEIKVCDPAIGSGAFPMGILNEIFQLVNKLFDLSDAVKTIWGMEFWQPNVVKQCIIQNSIYGVDIEKGAVDIARLRFWLSLIIDEPEPKPLPHLNYKIVVGNSLVSKFEDSVIEIDWEIKDSEQTYLYVQDAVENERRILSLISEKQGEVFNPASDIQKIIAEIKRLKIELLINKVEMKLKLEGDESIPVKSSKNYKKQILVWEQTLSYKSILSKLYKLREQPTEDLRYFDWKLDFPEVMNEQVAEKVGFDIVIGNPPYIQLQKMGKETDILQEGGFETFARTGDIYCLFYEKGIDLLKKESGVLSYITSNSWMKTKYGEPLRKFFIEKSNPVKLLNFEDTQLFPSATVEVNILISKRQKYSYETESVALLQDSMNKSIQNYFEENKIVLDNLNNSEWIILSKSDFEIKRKIEGNNKTIGDLDYNINIGINTGLNEVFIISEELRNEFINQDEKNREILVPILKGRNLKKYGYSFENNFLINAHNGLKKQNVPPVNIEKDYPVIFNYFINFKEKLLARWDQGTNWYNLRNCAYLDDFEKDKIIWGELSDKAKFSFDNKKFMLDATVFLMTGEKLKVLYCILNSTIGNWYFNIISTTSGMGTNRWKKYKIQKFPLPKISEEINYLFEKIAEYLIYLNDPKQETVLDMISNEAVSQVFEDLVNMMVYELYFEEEMKAKEIDVLQFVTEKAFPDITQAEDKKATIQKVHYELKQKDSPIRNRIFVANSRSETIARINAATC